MDSVAEPSSELTELWRFEQLLSAGYSMLDAAVLASDSEVDLHEALDLVRAGCPHELAFRILM